MIKNLAPDTDWDLDLRRSLQAYETPSLSRASVELSITLLILAALWVLIARSVAGGGLLWLVLSPLAGFALVRTFAILHDCSHDSFFPQRKLNQVVGSLLGVVTMTPFHLWRRTHLRHHSAGANLDQNDFGYIRILTTDQYCRLSRVKRAVYRVYHYPLFLFGLGPLLHFVLIQRITLTLPRAWRRERASVHWTNIGIVLAFVSLASRLGIAPTLVTHMLLMAIATSVGLWVFHTHHIFENSGWRHQDQWTFVGAALRGSSYLDVPETMHWISGWIGIHHIHHLDTRIPCYRLSQCFRDQARLQQVHRVTIRESIAFARFALWDDRSNRFVTFK